MLKISQGWYSDGLRVDFRISKHQRISASWLLSQNTREAYHVAQLDIIAK